MLLPSPPACPRPPNHFMNESMSATRRRLGTAHNMMEELAISLHRHIDCVSPGGWKDDMLRGERERYTCTILPF